MARVLKGFQFYLHIHTFIRNRNEPYLPLPSQPQLVLIYRPGRDGRLSRPWCEVVPAEIRTCNLPIANPALYHTATSAPSSVCLVLMLRPRGQNFGKLTSVLLTWPRKMCCPMQNNTLLVISISWLYHCRH